MRQFLKFICVGVSNVLISEGIYAVLVILGWHYALAYTLGFAISVLNAYFWNSRFVFTDGQMKKGEEGEDASAPLPWWKVLLKTYAAYGFGYILNVSLLFLWIDVIGIAGWMGPITDLCIWAGWAGATSETVAKLAAEALDVVITTPINFFINKFWTFKK